MIHTMVDDPTDRNGGDDGRPSPQGVDATSAQLKSRAAVQAELDDIYQRDRLGMHVLEDYIKPLRRVEKTLSPPFDCDKKIAIQAEIAEVDHDTIKENLEKFPDSALRLHSTTLVAKDVKVVPFDCDFPIALCHKITNSQCISLAFPQESKLQCGS